MNQKESLDCTVKDHDLNLLVSFDCRDDLVHLRKHLRTEDVERAVVKRDSPILGRAPVQTYLTSLRCYVILIFHICCLPIFGFTFDFALRSFCQALSSRGFDEVVPRRKTLVIDHCEVLLRLPSPFHW